MSRGGSGRPTLEETPVVEPVAPAMEEPPVAGPTLPGGGTHDEGDLGDEGFLGAVATSVVPVGAGAEDAGDA